MSKWPSYKKAEYLVIAPSFEKDVDNYGAPYFYMDLEGMQEKYQYIKNIYIK